MNRCPISLKLRTTGTEFKARFITENGTEIPKYLRKISCINKESPVKPAGNKLPDSTKLFKLKAIKLVKQGNTITEVAKMLNLSSLEALSLWLAHFNNGGIKQLKVKNMYYSPEFKQKVVEFKRQHALSFKKTAAYFAIPSLSIIHNWEKQYLLYGIAGLKNKKDGGIPMKYKPKKRKPAPDYVETLETELEKLRMENDFLKKYYALVQEEEKEKRRKQR